MFIIVCHTAVIIILYGVCRYISLVYHNADSLIPVSYLIHTHVHMQMEGIASKLTLQFFD